jgi:hypothetical protein
MNPFIGTWSGPDEYTSEVEYTVAELAGTLVVSAVDPSDGETADVSGVAVSDGKLIFTALWKSTGRVAQCVIELVGHNDAQLTFTYTDHAPLIRKAV